MVEHHEAVEHLRIEHDPARAAFLGELQSFVGVVEGLTDRDLLSASRCHGWALLDVVVHVRTGLQEMLAA